MRTILTLFLAISLSSCASNAEILAAYSKRSSMSLCSWILNDTDQYSWARNPRLEVLASRGEDCSQYLHLRNVNPEQNVNIDINNDGLSL